MAVKEGRIPDDWKYSLLIYLQGQGSASVCGSHTGIKLLQHVVKVAEKVIQHRIRQQMKIMICSSVACQDKIQQMQYLW